MGIEEALFPWADQRGYRTAAAPASLLDEVRRSIERRWVSGEIDAGFFRNSLSSFRYLQGCRIEAPASIILIAMPRPAHIIEFTTGGRAVETVIPPTYVRYRQVFEDVCADLAAAAADGRFEVLSAPLKALASRMGLIAYGRNNVGYIDGLGSYFQLIGLLSDVPVSDRAVHARSDEAALGRCRECRICAAACPTGAISLERFLIRAERCYTLYSESMDPFPEGLVPPSPQCLVGCLKCQEACPENRGRLKYERTGISFNEKETAEFLGLRADSYEGLDRAADKLRPLGLSEDALPFARNLRLALGRMTPAP
jgi:epoxyqueuosine reductase